jgi:hypothetical protein
MSILSRTVLVAVVIFGPAAIIGRLLITDRMQHIEHQWAGCTSEVATQGLKQDLTLNHNELLVSILGECRSQFAAAVASCEAKTGCEERLQRTAFQRIGMIREALAWTHEEARKRGIIGRAVRQIEKDGVTRDDIKAFFRDEILEDEATDKTTEMEARASSLEDAKPPLRLRP